MTIEFKAWPKTPRLFRDIVITEKIDGTNSAVIIQELDVDDPGTYRLAAIERDGVLYEVAAQSRNRLITPGKATDNYGFAAFVQANAEALFDLLGPGHHFGEWSGEGIGKRYGDYVKGKRFFSLFNTHRYRDAFEEFTHEGRRVWIEPVPVLFDGQFSESAIQEAASALLSDGSLHAPFAPNPEGIMIHHTQSKQVYKFTFDNNDKGKWETL
jgi:hypothetical protein